MENQKNRILAIDPGSRLIGLAGLDGEEIIYFGVKCLKKYRPKKNLNLGVQSILLRLIDEYKFTCLVLENGWFSQFKSPLFQAVFKGIQASATKKKIPLYSYSPKTIRKEICDNGKANKRKTALMLTRKYPELKIYLEQDYWLHGFDALAAAQTHLKKYQKK